MTMRRCAARWAIRWNTALFRWLAEEGADAALMSGSGSAVFALSRDIAVLERLRQKAEALGCDSWLTQRC